MRAIKIDITLIQSHVKVIEHHHKSVKGIFSHIRIVISLFQSMVSIYWKMNGSSNSNHKKSLKIEIDVRNLLLHIVFSETKKYGNTSFNSSVLPRQTSRIYSRILENLKRLFVTGNLERRNHSGSLVQVNCIFNWEHLQPGSSLMFVQRIESHLFRSSKILLIL